MFVGVIMLVVQGVVASHHGGEGADAVLGCDVWIRR